VTARQDALTASLRTALTRSERRAAVRAFSAPETVVEERAALNKEMRECLRGLRAQAIDFRAMGETTTTAGGYSAPAGFASEVVRLVKNYDSVIADCEDYPTDDGNAFTRSATSSFTASGSAASENSQLSDVTGTVAAFPSPQVFGRTPTYAALTQMSFQLMEDAMRPSGAPDSPDGSTDIVQILSESAAESIGRQIASVASPALYAGATTGQEVALTTLTVSTVATMLGSIDAGYLAGAKLYLSSGDFALLAANDVTGLSNLAKIVPIVPTNACTTWVSGTVSGPVLANLGRFMTMRRVRSQFLKAQRLNERFADSLQVGILVYSRVDFLARGEVTSAVFAK
jgi:HK97 family phage major capsid protein